MNIKSTTNTICLLGHPVKHSFSPKIHNYLFEKYNQEKVYVCFDIEEKNLGKGIDGIRALGILGCNITIPHKVNVMNYLDNVEKNAKIIGAVNTIKNEGGILTGYNTDGVGFSKSIIDSGYGLEDKRVLIIGAGGACRSIAVDLASNKVKSIEIRNRTLSKAIDIVDTIKEKFDIAIQEAAKILEIEISSEKIPTVVKELALGDADENIKVAKKILVCDIVYKPFNTNLIKWAKNNKLDVVYGIDMLINQGLHAFYIWTGIKPTKEDFNNIKEIYQKEYKII